MFCKQFFFRDKMDSRPVRLKIMGHGFDCSFYLRNIRSFFRYYITNPLMTIRSTQVRLLTFPHLFKCRIQGDGVLDSIFHSIYSSYCVGMTLTDPPTPKGVILSFRQNTLTKNRSEERRVGKECRSRWR